MSEMRGSMDKAPPELPPAYSRRPVQGETTAAPSTSTDSAMGSNSVGETPRGQDDRPLPTGWVRQWSAAHNHYFFVDTFMTPERSIWVHPLDDPEFLRQHPEYKKSSDSEFAPPAGPPPPNGQASGSNGAGASRSQFSDPITHAHPSHQDRIRQAGERAAEEARKEPLPTGLKKATRAAKDKSTGKDHVARARERAEKKETELIAEEEERRTAQAFQRAASTGQAQYLGQSGKSKLDYYAEPPAAYYPPQWLRVWPPPLSFEARQEGQKVFLRPASPGGYGRGYGGGAYGGRYGGYGPGIGMGGLGLLGGGMLMGGLLF